MPNKTLTNWERYTRLCRWIGAIRSPNTLLFWQLGFYRIQFIGFTLLRSTWGLTHLSSTIPRLEHFFISSYSTLSNIVHLVWQPSLPFCDHCGTFGRSTIGNGPSFLRYPLSKTSRQFKRWTSRWCKRTLPPCFSATLPNLLHGTKFCGKLEINAVGHSWQWEKSLTVCTAAVWKAIVSESILRNRYLEIFAAITHGSYLRRIDLYIVD